MNTATIMNSVISLFLIMLAGVYGGRKGFLKSDVTKGLTDMLLEIALPCMIITAFSFSYDENIKSNILKTFYYSFFTYILLAIVSKLLMRPIIGEKKTILHFANIFTNTGYIGFPILNAVYGAEAVVYGAIFNMFFVIFLWTYGIMLFQRNAEKDDLIKQVLQALKNPSLIAVYIGILMMIFDLKLPDVVSLSASAIGGMTGPVSMLLVGAMTYKINIKAHLSDWTIYYGIAVKLIALPAVLYLVSLLIRDGSIVADSVIILAAMPAAAMTSIFADRFDYNKEYAAVMVVATTLLSMFTVPILLRVLI